MKKEKLFRYTALFLLCSFALLLSMCSDDDEPSASSRTATISGLVADSSGFAAVRIDTTLANAWGMVIADNGRFYIASNQRGSIVVFDKSGNQVQSPIIVPARVSGSTGSPTGLTLNSTAFFKLPGTDSASKVIAVSEDGLVTVWRSGPSAVIAARGDSLAVYKGVAQAANRLYVANFSEKRIDVYDSAFERDTGFNFKDPTVPADFGPFNIALVNGVLYITYAKLGPGGTDDQAGPGNGYVSIFNTNGGFVKRFASQGMLNSPWGLTKAPSEFGAFSNKIRVGNFGDGKISAFDESTGASGGQLMMDTSQIVIDGLWALAFPKGNSFSDTEKSSLYFTAGPDDEIHGLFGFLKLR